MTSIKKFNKIFVKRIYKNMNNNLLGLLSSLFGGSFAQNGQNFSGANGQNGQNGFGQNAFGQNGYEQNGFGQNNIGQNGQGQNNSVYAQSFPDEAYQNVQNSTQNEQPFNPNMLSALLSMMGKNGDLSSLSSIFSANKQEQTEKSGQKKSPPEDDDIII